MKGEEFLNKLYKDLILSDEFTYTSNGSKDKDEAVKRYMNRLETIHNKVNNEHKLELLKNLYYKKYIVKEEDIPEEYEDKQKIINAQKESLDKWLNYLLDENSRYPMWAKYWAFQGMLKIGIYSQRFGDYGSRSKYCLSPFVEFDSKVLDECIGMLVNHVDKSELTDKELDKLIESVKFETLYIFLLDNTSKDLGDKEPGIWVTYHHETNEEAENKEKNGIEPEYLKLYNSFKKSNVNWIKSKEHAKVIICGDDWVLRGGSYYVYYTKDNDDQYTVPRVGIKMDRLGKISYIIGRDDKDYLHEGYARNYLEEGFEEIISKKIHTLGLSQNELTRTLKILSDNEKIIELNNKVKNKIEFDNKDIKFIYGKVIGFDGVDDQRIDKLRNRRSKKSDFSKLSKFDIIELIKIKPFYLKYVSTNIEGYKEIALEAIKNNVEVLKDVPFHKDYYEMAMEAVKNDVNALYYVNSSLVRKYKEIAIEAVKNNGYAIQFISTDVEGYKEMAIEAVKNNGYAIQFIPTDVEGYKEIAMEAVKNDGCAIQFIPTDVEGYKELIMLERLMLENESQNNNAKKR